MAIDTGSKVVDLMAALKAALKGCCPVHPKYKAKFPPRADCAGCKEIWSEKTKGGA